MENFFGSLSVFMFVTMPNGRDKRVTLATIPCEYAERETVFRKFVDANDSCLLKSRIHAEFVMRDYIHQ